MVESGPDEDKIGDLKKVFAKRKAIAGVVLILAASFGVLLTFTDLPGDVTGYFLAEEEPEVVLANDLQEKIGEYEEVYDEEEALVRAVGDWVYMSMGRGYTEEEMRRAMEVLGKDPDLVDEFTE